VKTNRTYINSIYRYALSISFEIFFDFFKQISSEHHISEKILGKGEFGIVFEGKLDGPQTVAVKILHDFS
jgi:hypothetical protein